MGRGRRAAKEHTSQHTYGVDNPPRTGGLPGRRGNEELEGRSRARWSKHADMASMVRPQPQMHTGRSLFRHSSQPERRSECTVSDVVGWAKVEEYKTSPDWTMGGGGGGRCRRGGGPRGGGVVAG